MSRKGTSKQQVTESVYNKGNNKITELRTVLQRESQNSQVYKQTKSVNNRKTVKMLYCVVTWSNQILILLQNFKAGDIRQ
jgi:flagellar basal body P-ring protein FlgI